MVGKSKEKYDTAGRPEKFTSSNAERAKVNARSSRKGDIQNGINLSFIVL